MNNLAKEINNLLLNDESVKEYLTLKKEIENDKELEAIYDELDALRREVCKNKEKDSNEYYALLDKEKEIPFGPFLILGLYLVFLFMEPINTFIAIIF